MSETPTKDVMELAKAIRGLVAHVKSWRVKELEELLPTIAAEMTDLMKDRDLYKHRCIELVRLNDAANTEIEKLRARLRKRQED